MKQSQLDRAVADATGETRETIRRRGFTLLELADAVNVPRIPDNTRARSTQTHSDSQPDEIDSHHVPTKCPSAVRCFVTS